MSTGLGVAKELRLAEIIASLSLATDLGDALPLEEAMRNTVLAVELGQAIGLAGPELSDVYYLALLRYLGGTAFAHELAGIEAKRGHGPRALPVDEITYGAVSRRRTTLVGMGPEPW